MDDTQSRVDAAQTTLSNFTHDPDMTWFRNHVGDARAVLISPQIVQAGFIVGGSGGPAVVIARNRSGTAWNGPAFYRLASGSIGLQAGAQSSEMVALVMTDKALNSLLSTTFKLGGGVNVEGTVIEVDDGRNRAYYGQAATPVDILVTRSVSNPAGAPLAQAVASAVRSGR